MSQRLLRVAIIYIPLAVLSAFVVPFIIVWSRLPDTVATHWSGAPDGSMPRLVALAFVCGLWLFFAGRAAWPTLKHTQWDDPPGETSTSLVPPLTTLYLVAGVLLFAHGLVLWANLDAPHWTAAKHAATIPTVGGVLGAAIVAASIGRLLERTLSDAKPDAATTPETLDIHDSERVVWWAHATNQWLQFISLAASALVFLAAPEHSSVVVRYGVPLVIAILGMLFSNVHVIAANDDLTIELGPWRWPRKVIPISNLDDVEVRAVEPLRRGGWGYRSCAPRCRAFIIRAGDALVLKQRDGRILIVTIDDASRGAALIKALKDQLLT